MIINYGEHQLQDSEQVAHYAKNTMVPQLLGGEHKHVLAKHVLASQFSRHPDYRDVTRDPDDTIVHDHDRHVLLIRSGLHVPDNTLICDTMEGIRALARAGMEQGIEQKLKAAPANDMSTEQEVLEALATGFSFLRAGTEHNLDAMLTAGHTTLRSYMVNVPGLRDEIRDELNRTLVRAHHEIPENGRDVVRWDSDNVDVMLIGAQTGHARSLLHIDYKTATPEELREALGGGVHPKERGLHFAALEAQK